jgi:hypothetical protein
MSLSQVCAATVLLAIASPVIAQQNNYYTTPHFPQRDAYYTVQQNAEQNSYYTVPRNQNFSRESTFATAGYSTGTYYTGSNTARYSPDANTASTSTMGTRNNPGGFSFAEPAPGYGAQASVGVQFGAGRVGFSTLPSAQPFQDPIKQGVPPATQAYSFSNSRFATPVGGGVPTGQQGR